MRKILRYLREENNYSQNSVASFLGISRQMYIKYENGEVEPPLKIVTDLAKIYRVSYEVIIEDKVPSVQNEAKYVIHEQNPLEFHDSGSVNPPSFYLSSILEMLPKLIYEEQLKLLSKLSSLVHNETEKLIEPTTSNKMQAFQKILSMNEELHLKSDGKKWSREDLYERH